MFATMKDTQKKTPVVELLEKLSPELNQLREELRDLIGKFDKFSEEMPEGVSFCLLTAFSFTQEKMPDVNAGTARICGGDEFDSCLIAGAKRLKEKNAPLFDL